MKRNAKKVTSLTSFIYIFSLSTFYGDFHGNHFMGHPLHFETAFNLFTCSFFLWWRRSFYDDKDLGLGSRYNNAANTTKKKNFFFFLKPLPTARPTLSFLFPSPFPPFFSPFSFPYFFFFYLQLARTSI